MNGCVCVCGAPGVKGRRSLAGSFSAFVLVDQLLFEEKLGILLDLCDVDKVLHA